RNRTSPFFEKSATKHEKRRKIVPSNETYKNIIINCFRYLGYVNLQDIKELTLYEYEARMHAYKLSQVDKERDMHLQAWLNYQVTATKESGKKQVPVFKSFKEFYNYERNLKEIESHMNETNKLSDDVRRKAQIAKRLNGRRELMSSYSVEAILKATGPSKFASNLRLAS